jgi:PAS domain S-box-containing protein
VGLHDDSNHLPADWSTLFDLLPVGAYRSSPNGRQLRANAALVRLNGYASEAEMLAAVHDIAREWYVEPGRRAEFQRLLERDGKVTGFVSEVLRHRTRERIWVSENAHAVRDASGQVVCYEGTVEDITERVRTQQALQRGEAQWRMISAQFPGVVYRARIRPGEPPQFDFVSEGVRDVYGVEPQELMRDGALLQRMRHPDDAQQVGQGLDAARVQHAPHSAQFRIVRRDGQVRWVLGTTNLVAQGEDGDVRTGVILDITAEREAAGLREARDRAEAAQRLTRALLSRISHELRTPLNAVLGFAQLLEGEPALDERSRQWVSHILVSGRHLLALVEDVLDLSGAESGELQVELQDADLAAALKDSWTMLSGQAEAAGVTLVPPAAPLPAVRADPKRLRQVLTNLLSNAVKYNRPGGHVVVSVQRVAERVAIEVADTGPGLSEDQTARLFQPFNRLGAESGPVEGTGLGLALSRQLAIAMGGKLEVRSEPGQGACFTLALDSADA